MKKQLEIKDSFNILITFILPCDSYELYEIANRHTLHENCKNTENYINAICTVGTSLIFATEILILASDQFVY